MKLSVGVERSEILAEEGEKGDGGWKLEVSRFKYNARDPGDRWSAFEVGCKKKKSGQCIYILEDYGEGAIIRSSSCSGFSALETGSRF